jgi:putative tryptophan/tyrosine transport system substrate-binding protein
MRRREFITLIGGATAAWPLAARAQQLDRIRHIAVIFGYAETDPETKLRIAALRLGLEKRGWSEGRNIRIHYFFAPADMIKEGVAKETVAIHPEVILAHGTTIAAAVQRESREIPVVFVNVSDPIGSGFITNMARPGANLTGVMQYEPGIVSKWLLMLKEIAPRTERVAVLANPKSSPFDYFLSAARAAAVSLALEIVPSPVENSPADIERVFDTLARTPNSGFVATPDTTTTVHRDIIVALAAKHRLPAVYAFQFFVQAGGLMSYGVDPNENYRLGAAYVDRILRGDKPAELPVQAPTRFETSVNIKAAKAIGLAIPPGLLVAADEVIE